MIKNRFIFNHIGIAVKDVNQSKKSYLDLSFTESPIGDIYDDIQNIINKRPASVPDFLRTAKNLTNEDWIELTKHVEKMKKKGK